MRRALVLAVCVLAAAGVASARGLRGSGGASKPDGAKQLTDRDFNSEVGGDKAVLVDFYLNNCGHCKRLKPEYESLAKKYSNNPHITFAAVNAYEQTTNDRYGITGYPTLLFFSPKSTKAEKYTGPKTAAAIQDWLAARLPQLQHEDANTANPAPTNPANNADNANANANANSEAKPDANANANANANSDAAKPEPQSAAPAAAPTPAQPQTDKPQPDKATSLASKKGTPSGLASLQSK